MLHYVAINPLVNGVAEVANFLKAPNLEELVHTQVRQRSPRAENIRTIHMQQFLDGKLYTVVFDAPNDAGEVKNWVNKVFARKNSIAAFGHDHELITIVGQTHARSFWDFFANSEIVAGVIAVVVTIMILGSYVISLREGSPNTPPEWITSGWLLILGFDFGRASGRSSD